MHWATTCSRWRESARAANESGRYRPAAHVQSPFGRRRVVPAGDSNRCGSGAGFPGARARAGARRAVLRGDRTEAAAGCKVVGGDRLAYAPAARTPWSWLEAATGRCCQSEVDDAAVGVPRARRGTAFGTRTLRPASGSRVARRATPRKWRTGACRVGRRRGCASHAAGRAEHGGLGHHERGAAGRLFIAVRRDVRDVHRVPIVD